MEKIEFKELVELGLTEQDAIQMFETMVRARKIDERMWKLNRAGKIPFLVSCQGQEAAQVGAAFALEKGTDYILPYYRDLGVVLHFGQTSRDIMLSAFAKAEDPNSGGRQMPGHYGSRALNIVTGSSPVTTQVPHAVGIALAAKMRKEPLVAYVSFGEGSSNQGDFHEGANFAEFTSFLSSCSVKTINTRFRHHFRNSCRRNTSLIGRSAMVCQAIRWTALTHSLSTRSSRKHVSADYGEKVRP